jgi:hypothetical protein
MKALSLYQPWAWLMVNGYKDIENRTWKPSNPWLKFRGICLVHASKTIDEDCYTFVRDKFPALRASLPTGDQLKRGGIVGQFDIVDCVTEHPSPWFFGLYGFVVRDAKPLPFVPCKGALGFFEIPAATYAPTQAPCADLFSASAPATDSDVVDPRCPRFPQARE